MTHLVLGGTGTVGSAVVQGLLARGESVRVVTRSKEKSAQLPEGAAGVVGDLQDPDTYRDVFDGADTVFLLNAVAPTELQEGLAALNEAKRIGAKRLVHVSVHDVEKGIHVPHFASKIAIEAAIVDSGLPYTILRPNNFHQNDYWFKDVMLQFGVYPQPIGGKGISRIDVRDIADAAVRALTGDGPGNGVYTLAGPDVLTGEDCARIWSEALGREIAYGGDDLEAWSAQARQMLPAWMVYDFAMMYAMFQEKGLAATDSQLEETREAVGAEPRSFADFVRETAASWK